MPSPITFSDDEDTVRFSRQLQALDISQLMKPAVLSTSAERGKLNSEEKENVPWRAMNNRVKDEVEDDSYVFVASPVKQRSVKIELPEVSEMDENIIKQEPLDEDDFEEQKPQPYEWWGVNRGRGIVLERLCARQELATPDRVKAEERDEWDVDVKVTPSVAKTPRSAATTKRRRILRQIKTEMAEKAESTWDRNADPDFVYVGEVDEEKEAEEATPTSLRLRLPRRRSRISYRNQDWSTEANDRKRNRHAALLVDESEEEREAERERDRQERREKVAMKRRWTKESIASIPSVTVPSNVFSISDDEPLSEIARSMRKEDEGDEDYKGERTPTRRRKKMKLAIENSDDDSLAAIASRLKKEEEEKGEKRTGKIENENEEGKEEGEYTIRRRRRPLIDRSSLIQ
ncbi:hypothetical protein PENTCL1PPCAC_24523 [Pristionchus entomophagus]|uniref:Uncharacterized protein n=1 Tax=Pristionchus entomophagus TaxID=358040 RepID=A0AAV5U886_9BILA|nr:hypothetical protein PENTCL1PPCAC_24523 [Pristionchus entomophagus]